MVMGPTHAVSGAVAGLAVAEVLPLEWGGPRSTAEVFAFAGVCAGAALLPDLDTAQSTVSRSFGPVSQALARIVDSVSLGIHEVTRGRKDGRRRGGHRTFTHTAVFAAGLGALVSLAVARFDRHAVSAVLFVTLGLALRGLAGSWATRNGWIGVTATSAVLTAAVWHALPDAIGSTGLGVAVAVGCAVHCLGDAITKEGIPFLAPFVPWRGQRWWEIRLPGLVAIRAGGPAEVLVVGPLLTIALMALAMRTVRADGGLWSAAAKIVGLAG